MRAKVLAAPMGGFSLIAGSILIFGAYFYVFLGAAPVTGVVRLHAFFALNGLISLDSFFTLGHMATYGVLTLGLCAFFRSVGSRPAIAATLMGMGVAIEVLQEEFFGRHFQLADVAANMTGIAVALGLLAITACRRSR